MGSKKTKTTQTTTPVISEPYSGQFIDYTGMIGDFLDMDPAQFVAPTSSLQQSAFDQAGSLGGWQPYLDQASSYANQVAGASAPQVTATGYQTPDVPSPYQFGGAQLGSPTTYGGAQLGDAAQATSAQLGTAPSYGGATLGPAAQYGGTQLGSASLWGGAQLGPAAGMTAAQLGSAPTYGGAQLGPATTFGGAQLGAAPMATSAQLGPASQAGFQDILSGPGSIDQFMNPALEAYVTSTLANYDQNAAEQRAQMMGSAGPSAFGGSRLGVQLGQYDADTGLNRALAEAGLRSQAYTDAAGMAMTEAARRQALDLTNTDALNRFGLQQGLIDQQTGLSNQAMAGQYGLTQGQFGQQAGLASMDALNQYGLQQGAFQQQAGLSNQAMAGQYGLQQGAFQQDANARTMDALNSFAMQQGLIDQQTGQVNQQAMNDFMVQQGLLDQQTGALNMEALNSFLMQQGAFQQQAGLASLESATQYGVQQGLFDQQTAQANQAAINQFAMQQGLLDQQTGQMNMEAFNQFAMQQGLLDQQTGQYNTDALNSFLMTQVGMDENSARYYADALNQASFQNANLTQQQQQQQLAAGGLLGNLGGLYGQQNLADLGATAELGTLQRLIESDYLNAYPTQLQLAGNLYQQLNPALYAGSYMTGTSKTSGGLLPQLLGSAMQAGAMAFGPSDRRLKTDIERIGSHGPLGLYRFRFIGDEKERVGVMADEVAEHFPEALGPVMDGYATVNYDRLGLGHLLEA